MRERLRVQSLWSMALLLSASAPAESRLCIVRLPRAKVNDRTRKLVWQDCREGWPPA